MDQLTQLKRLLFEEEQDSLERLQNRVERPTTRAQDVAEVLAESFNLNDGDDGDLAIAMRSTVNECISESVRTDPNSFADALFPVIGPAIRKAVAESIAALAERINRALDHSVSPRGLKWRFESIRTGIPLSEIILRETLVYRVEEAFVIQPDTGLLIAHEAGAEVSSQDSDAVSAMLTAIEDFVRDSFKGEEQSDLDTMNIGGKTVWLFHGPKATIAGVIRGNPPSDLREKFYQVNEEVHANFADRLGEFAGDRAGFEGVGQLLLPLIASQSLRERSARDKSSFKPLAAIAAVLILVVLMLVYFEYRQGSNRDRLIEALNDVAGVEVLDRRESGGVIRIRALRDPLANLAPDIATSYGFDEDEVVIDLIPFHSLDPEVAVKRAAQILQPPPTVELDLRGNRLVLSGRASAEWSATARSFPLGIGGIEQIDFTGLGLNLEALLALARDTLEIPESVVLDVDTGRLIGRGTAPLTWLRNARDTKTRIASIEGFDFSDVIADPASVIEYIRATVNIPDSVELRYSDKKLIIAGSAPFAWREDVQTAISDVGYIEGLETADFVVAERSELDTLIESNRNFQILFSKGLTLTDESRAAIRDFSLVVARIVELDRLLEDVRVKFSVTGHTDNTGTVGQNEVVRGERAGALANVLTDNGVELSAIALADSAHGRDDADRAQARSAELQIYLTTD